MIKRIGIVFWLLSFNAYAMDTPFWKSHTLVLVYASTCPHCHNQATVLAPWVQSTGIPYVLFSVDNQPIAPFNRFFNAPESFLRTAYPDGKIMYPALFIVENQEQKLYPVSYGFLTAEELNERMNVVARKIIQFEQGGI